MKNLKKVLALALVFAMTLTLFAGAAFTDQASIGVDYLDDVNMLVELGVLKGYANGEFRPENNVTRAEFAKMAYTLKYGADDQGLLFSGSQSAFSDVEGVSSVAWAKGYINYCANQKIIAGVGNGKFNPGGNVTVAEAAKMLLVILGCNPQTEGFVGANWQGNVVAKAIELGVFDGWTGNPTQPATRQLVAKLMRNTVFAPIYVYSPITGAGSQKDVMNPKEDNITLGQQTMGLERATGIVVANENHAIRTDAEGEEFFDDVTAKNANQPLIFTKTKDTTTIAYLEEDVQSDGNFYWDTLVLKDYDMGDEMLGSIVDVYYKHEVAGNKNSKIQLIGDVLVNSKTVVYEVAAKDIDFMPNGTEKKGSYEPYIKATTADGEEIIINSKYDAADVPANVDYKTTTLYPNNDFISVDPDGDGTYEDVSIFYQLGTSANLKAPATLVNSMGAEMIQSMGTYNPITYRLVSNDGGKTISYIFCNSGYEAGEVKYNEAKGTVTMSGVGTNLEVGEDVEIYEGLQKGDYAVATYENGKYFLHPTETVTGAATGINKNSAVINGETYYGSTKLCNGVTLAQWYANGAGQNYRKGATYYTYGNLLLDVDTDAEVTVSMDEYAVVLGSDMDAYTNEPKVTLGLADGSKATYYVTSYDDATSGDVLDLDKVDGSAFTADFANDALVGTIVEYKLSGGKAKIEVADVGNAAVKTGTSGSIANGVFGVVDSGTTHNFYAADGAVMFILYNNKPYTPSGGSPIYSEKVQFKVYKLEDLDNSILASGAIKTAATSDPTVVKAMKTSSSSNEILFGVMSFDNSGNYGEPSIGASNENVGLIVDSVYRYDFDAREESVELSILSFTEKAIISGVYKDWETGYVTGFGKADSGNDIEDKANATQKLGVNAIVSYTHDGTNFTALKSRETVSTLGNGNYNGTPGTSVFRYATIVDERSDRIIFYPYGTSVTNGVVTAPMGGVAPDTKNIHEYVGMTSIAVMDNEIVGDDIEEISKQDDILATDYNAIIEILDGQIIKVISLHDNIDG